MCIRDRSSTGWRTSYRSTAASSATGSASCTNLGECTPTMTRTSRYCSSSPRSSSRTGWRTSYRSTAASSATGSASCTNLGECTPTMTRTSRYCSSSPRSSSRTCRQLTQQKVQKSSKTILPRRSASERSRPPVFSQPRPSSSDARTRDRREPVVVTASVNTTGGHRHSTLPAAPLSRRSKPWSWSEDRRRRRGLVDVLLGDLAVAGVLPLLVDHQGKDDREDTCSHGDPPDHGEVDRTPPVLHREREDRSDDEQEDSATQAHVSTSLSANACAFDCTPAWRRSVDRARRAWTFEASHQSSRSASAVLRLLRLRRLRLSLRREHRVVRVELGVAVAVGSSVAPPGGPLVVLGPRHRDRDRQREGRQLADAPRDATALLLVSERRRAPCPAEQSEPLRHEERRACDQGDPEERVERHRAEQEQEPERVRGAFRARVDPDPVSYTHLR